MTFGDFGANAAALPNTPFFRWFHLTVCSFARPGCYRYQPEGDSFRERVALDVELAPGNLIGSLLLTVDRDFIDDPRWGGFAADIVASFLDAVASSEAATIAPVVAALHRLMIDRPGTIVRAGTLPPDLPLGDLAPILSAYQGYTQRCQLSLPPLSIIVENTVRLEGTRIEQMFQVAVTSG